MDVSVDDGAQHHGGAVPSGACLASREVDMPATTSTSCNLILTRRDPVVPGGTIHHAAVVVLLRRWVIRPGHSAGAESLWDAHVRDRPLLGGFMGDGFVPFQPVGIGFGADP